MQRRMTQRKKQILNLLATTDIERLEWIHRESRIFSFSAICTEVFGTSDYQINQSQKRSLYKTLAEMVKEELIVIRYAVDDSVMGDLPKRFSFWHLPHKLNDDLSFIRWHAPEYYKKITAIDEYMIIDHQK